MTDFPVVPPPADGLADAFRTAAGRRRRTAAGAGGAGLLSAALVLGALTGTSGQVLTSEPAPPADRSTVVNESEVVVEAPVDEAAPDPGAPGAPPAGTARTGPRSGGPAAQPPAAAPPVAPPAAGPRVQPGSPYRAAPMKRSTLEYTVPLVGCLGGADLCSSVRADGAQLVVSLCNQGVEPVRLDFAAYDEVDVEVRPQDKPAVLWRWGVGRPRVADPHQARLAVNACFEWTTPWTGKDQQGRQLPVGAYDLVARIDSPDAGPAATATGSYNRY